MLDDTQVNHYLFKKLGLVDWKLILKEDKLNFLQQLVKATLCNMYYENITWGSLSPSERTSPTIEEVIHQNLDDNGGACIHLNYFIKLILDHLNFTVFIVAGEAPILPLVRNHPVIIVKLEEELYLVDCGFGRPIFEPIPLNKLPYIGTAGGYLFEYRFNEDKNVYERYLHKGCPIKGLLEPGMDGKVDYFFDLKPLTFDDFQDTMKLIFSDPSASFFLNTIFLFKLVEFKSPQDFQFVSFRGRQFVQGSAENRTEFKFSTYKGMQPMIEKFFPLLNKDKLSRALFNYDNKSSS